LLGLDILDGSQVREAEGYVAGYFYPYDLFLISEYPSNLKDMVYLDFL